MFLIKVKLFYILFCFELLLFHKFDMEIEMYFCAEIEIKT